MMQTCWSGVTLNLTLQLQWKNMGVNNEQRALSTFSNSTKKPSSTFFFYLQIHQKRHKTSAVRQTSPTPTPWPAAGTRGSRKPTCSQSTPSTPRYGNSLYQKAKVKSVIYKICLSGFTTAIPTLWFQHFRDLNKNYSYKLLPGVHRYTIPRSDFVLFSEMKICVKAVNELGEATSVPITMEPISAGKKSRKLFLSWTWSNFH